ncbi:MAG: ribosome small subunit-dependent GTPase A [Spirochaetales bacterium]
MQLEDLGYTDTLKRFWNENDLNDFEPARVIEEHKEQYIVRNSSGEYEAEITGTLRYTASGREDFPAVGDWVAVTVYEGDLAIIHRILPRRSILKRSAVGRFGETQVIAANIDHAFLILAADRDFNLNRLERYLTLCNASRVNPIVVLSKIDLVDAGVLSALTERIQHRIGNIPLIPISTVTWEGLEALQAMIEKGKTYCLLGSSGVGKSTLVNILSGRTVMRTDRISGSTGKGRHVTSHRALVVLPNGGLLIDNPGMREVGIADSGEGLEVTFDRIARLAGECRFKDCTHTNETGCAVREALQKGEIDEDAYQNYLKLRKEEAYFESSLVERRKKDRAFGKMLKNYKKHHFRK